MASNRVTATPSDGGPRGDKETEDTIPPPETLTPTAVAAAAASSASSASAVPTTTRADELPPVETEGPSVETIEDVADHTPENTREAVEPARLQTSPAPGNGEGTSVARTRHHRNCIVSQTVHHHAPYLAEVPNALLGQVWIDHIVSTLSLFPEKTDVLIETT